MIRFRRRKSNGSGSRKHRCQGKTAGGDQLYQAESGNGPLPGKIADADHRAIIGTGVGGGIIINDRLLKGKSGAAGEMHFKMS